MDQLMAIVNNFINDQFVQIAGNFTEELVALKGFVLPRLGHRRGKLSHTGKTASRYDFPRQTYDGDIWKTECRMGCHFRKSNMLFLISHSGL
jgi:hypothetical protein